VKAVHDVGSESGTAVWSTDTIALAAVIDARNEFALVHPLDPTSAALVLHMAITATAFVQEELSKRSTGFGVSGSVPLLAARHAA
jgi:hypothetical protein